MGDSKQGLWYMLSKVYDGRAQPAELLDAIESTVDDRNNSPTVASISFSDNPAARQMTLNTPSGRRPYGLHSSNFTN